MTPRQCQRQIADHTGYHWCTHPAKWVVIYGVTQQFFCGLHARSNWRRRHRCLIAEWEAKGKPWTKLYDKAGYSRHSHMLRTKSEWYKAWYYEEPDGLEIYASTKGFIGTIPWRSLEASMHRRTIAKQQKQKEP